MIQKSLVRQGFSAVRQDRRHPQRTADDFDELADWSGDSFEINPGEFKDFGGFDKWDDEMDF